ncbi:MAG: hypothetical protein B6243_00085 [Anaerolineaceae bacterium 4572_5.2]|nr:MAG: hypothetical protein B6243_00085 [Anaerolineaceae bacterium 4572_5.2]
MNRGDTYIVGGACDTQGNISQTAGVEFENLLSANPQIDNQHLIYPGDIIKLP